MYEIETTTRVGNPTMPIALDFASGIVSLGSCFSDEVGRRMADSGFLIEQNPFGTLYNPASIASALERLTDDRELTEKDLVEHDGLWHSWHHHGSFSRATAEECLAVCNGGIHRGHQALAQASLLMVTFGSAWVYELPTMVVANCHKLPQEMFVRRRLSVEDIVALWHPLLDRLHTLYPSLHTLFTVSPMRHIGDGLHGNQLSKSTLLLAVDELVDRELPFARRKKKGVKTPAPERPLTMYFPSYEIVLDELRDYRYYNADMVHPSDLAVDIVWDRFQRSTMSPAVRDQAHFNAKQSRRARHIPLHPREEEKNKG
ncbi:MAG: GSCFA domain-containing protein [Bacteroidales bacterium]|nr:GSCFA domain-containing protein [Bacteroidales bacterium]